MARPAQDRAYMPAGSCRRRSISDASPIPGRCFPPETAPPARSPTAHPGPGVGTCASPPKGHSFAGAVWTPSDVAT
eukprot:6947898-Pyramimonas_sp.AAC.1